MGIIDAETANRHNKEEKSMEPVYYPVPRRPPWKEIHDFTVNSKDIGVF
jgi:hypothetical protein